MSTVGDVAIVPGLGLNVDKWIRPIQEGRPCLLTYSPFITMTAMVEFTILTGRILIVKLETVTSDYPIRQPKQELAIMLGD